MSPAVVLCGIFVASHSCTHVKLWPIAASFFIVAACSRLEALLNKVQNVQVSDTTGDDKDYKSSLTKNVNLQLLCFFLLTSIRLSISAVTIDNKKLNNKADHQSLTEKPGTIPAAHFIIRILMTSKNKPSVTIVIGMVSMMRIGFIKPLSNASTIARIIAVTLLLILTPGKIYDAINAATAVINIFPKNFIIRQSVHKILLLQNIFLQAASILPQ